MRQDSPIRVVVADDNEPMRNRLVSILAAAPSIHVVGEAGDGVEALERTVELVPDVLVLDIGMPRMDGLEAAKRIRVVAPSVRILVVSVHDDDASVLQMVRAGASGYILKETATDELVAGVRALHDGRNHFGQPALRTLVGHLDD